MYDPLSWISGLLMYISVFKLVIFVVKVICIELGFHKISPKIVVPPTICKTDVNPYLVKIKKISLDGEISDFVRGCYGLRIPLIYFL